MNKYHDVKKVEFDYNELHIIVDGKEYTYKLRNVSNKLLKATYEQRMKFEISPSGYGIHWPLIDEDLSIDGLLGIKHSIPEKEKAR